MRCVLGLDGGGTKTDCVLMDDTGAIMSPVDVSAIYAGVAGVGVIEAIPEITRRLEITFTNATVQVDTDLNVSLAATGEIPSVLVIAGTGSAVIGRTSPETFTREGGLGPILGDPGSAYDIGRQG